MTRCDTQPAPTWERVGLPVAFGLAWLLNYTLLAVVGHHVVPLFGLPMGILTVMTTLELRRNGGPRSSWLIVGGMLGSMVGDLIIQSYFLAAVGSFLLAHLLYLAAMGLPRERYRAHLLACLPAVLLWLGFYLTLVGHTPSDLWLPVMIYMTVISLMTARALGRGLVFPADTSARLFMVGAILFFVSDAELAINRWLVPLWWGPYFNGVTYFGGQLLIALATIRSSQEYAARQRAYL